jgi:DNA-binding LytR/AlgR family response regulator
VPLVIKKQGTVYQLFPEEIAFIESNRRKVFIHTLTNVIEAYASLSSICEKLPDNFAQCHKSFLVNLDLVKTLDAKTLHLKTGDQIPVSQTRKKETRQAFFERMTSLVD